MEVMPLRICMLHIPEVARDTSPKSSVGGGPTWKEKIIVQDG
jgi:hypothetical protein